MKAMTSRFLFALSITICVCVRGVRATRAHMRKSIHAGPCNIRLTSANERIHSFRILLVGGGGRVTALRL